MNRKALLIGNSNGLPGVKKDILHWYYFLKSDIGGIWFSSEIDIEMNPSKLSLLSKVNAIRGKFDFIIVVFSGHGAYNRSTILEINNNGECISENDLKNLAPRQISVFDCCRENYTQQDEILNESNSYCFLLKSGAHSYIRQFYETRIMKAIPQQISLYACSIGESAYDSNYGGYYTKNFLCSTNIFIDNQPFSTVGIIHQAAAVRTKSEVLEKENKHQKPDAFLPKCLSSQQLIISVNPQYFEQKRYHNILY